MIPTTSSVSQLTSKSTNPSSLDDDGGGAMTKNISKQYVSDYILSQPFDDGHNNDDDDDDMPTSQNGANKKTVIPPSIQQRKRMLPTAHIRRQQQQPPQKQLSSDRDDDAASTPDSASAMDEIESVPRGEQHSPSLSHSKTTTSTTSHEDTHSRAHVDRRYVAQERYSGCQIREFSNDGALRVSHPCRVPC